MFPGNPNIRVERKDLQEIKFPLAFKLCVDPDNNDSIVNYRKFGYQSSYNFFRGESMFNESLRGWNGHTKNHSILGTVKGLMLIIYEIRHTYFNHLEIISKVSFKWDEVVDYVKLYFTDSAGNKYFPKISGEALGWSPTPQFGSCNIFFLDHHLMKTKRLIQIFIYLNEIDKNRIMLTIQDKERVLTKRGLKSESDTYEGVPIEFDLENPRNRKYFFTINQFIHLEMESGINCKNYPFGGFSSYTDCDEDFVYNEMKNKHKVMPFWAAKNLDEVTALT